MCGILVYIDNESHSEEVNSSLSKLKHRGPDSQRVIVSGKNRSVITAGHTRLAIIDPTSGSQPFETDISILVVNGEIYNHKEMRNEVCNYYPYKTKSDCEVIIPMMERVIDGANIEEILNLLDGDFSFVYYNKITSQYIVARDPYGVTPLYYGIVNNAIVFTSEIKAISSGSVKIFNPGCYVFSKASTSPQIVLHPYYKHYDKSNAQNIHYQPVERLTAYDCEFTGDSISDSNGIITADGLNHINKLTTYAVQKRTMTDVPFGLSISGGLDSSLAAGIAVKHIREDSPDAVIHSFAVGLADSEDILAARVVAKQLGTLHHEIIVTMPEVINEIPKAVWFMETFDVASLRSGVLMMLMAKAVHAMGIKMIIGGDGADELFAGYAYFKYATTAEQIYSECQHKLQSLYQFDCLRGNKAMMAYSVEYRVPFLDLALVDYVHNMIPSINRSHALHNGVEKSILRMAFKNSGIIPDEILTRKKVQFSTGSGNMNEQLRAHANKLISDEQFATRSKEFPLMTPDTKESFWYRELFHSYFKHIKDAEKTVSYYPSINCSSKYALEWLPSSITSVHMEPS